MKEYMGANGAMCTLHLQMVSNGLVDLNCRKIQLFWFYRICVILIRYCYAQFQFLNDSINVFLPFTVKKNLPHQNTICKTNSFFHKITCLPCFSCKFVVLFCNIDYIYFKYMRNLLKQLRKITGFDIEKTKNYVKFSFLKCSP